jgi:hypothetical protein
LVHSEQLPCLKLDLDVVADQRAGASDGQGADEEHGEAVLNGHVRVNFNRVHRRVKVLQGIVALRRRKIEYLLLRQTLRLPLHLLLVGIHLEANVQEVGNGQARPEDDGQVDAQRLHAVNPAALTQVGGVGASLSREVCGNKGDEEE